MYRNLNGQIIFDIVKRVSAIKILLEINPTEEIKRKLLLERQNLESDLNILREFLHDMLEESDEIKEFLEFNYKKTEV